MLISNGASVDIFNKVGKSALEVAFEDEREEVARFLSGGVVERSTTIYYQNIYKLLNISSTTNF